MSFLLHVYLVEGHRSCCSILSTYGMGILYLTKITEVQINDTINKYIMNMSRDYT